MELIRGLHNLRPEHRGCVATIGNFDGVHLGHKAVLSQLAAKARALSLPALVMIFEPQPQEFFAPERVPARLTRLREKLHALDMDEVDRVLCVRFDAAFAAVAAEDFVCGILAEGLGVRYVVVGDDFRFGHRRRGDFEFLQAEGARLGFEVARRDTFSLNGVRVSSSRVREALERGDLGGARDLLGYVFNMTGRVAHGDKRGRTIGYPTANIYLHRRSVPLQGVFAVRVAGIDDDPLPAVANVGVRPTVGGTEDADPGGASVRFRRRHLRTPCTGGLSAPDSGREKVFFPGRAEAADPDGRDAGTRLFRATQPQRRRRHGNAKLSTPARRGRVPCV